MNQREKTSPGKLLFTIGLLTVTAAYSVWQYLGGQSPPTSGIPRENPMMPQSMMSSGQFINGSYVGKATDSFYGIVQVKAIIQGGRLTDVGFLKFPNDRETSIGVSNRSLPILRQEAITAQSADIDSVSGATQTAEAFNISLASALA